MTLNNTVIAGYLGAPAALREIPGSGTPVANLQVAQSYTFTGKNGREQKTNWFRVVAYGDVARIATQFSTGDNIIVDGHLETREWTGADGSHRRTTEIVARSVGRVEKLLRPDGPAAPVDAPPAPETEHEDWPTV